MSGKRVARHAQPQGRRAGLIGAAIVVVVVAAVLAVALGWLPGTSSGETDGAAASPQASSSADATVSDHGESPSSAPSPDETRSTRTRLSEPLRACASDIRAEERAVGAADAGVRNWGDHVQARTDMLDGRISVERMDAVWARTKAAGPADQERFDKQLGAVDQPSTCSRLQGSSEQRVANRCVQRSRAADRALESAEAAMEDWKVHLSNMAMYADGDMSASMAQGEWVRAWRNAPRNISAYQAARATLADAPPCPGAAS